LSSTKYLFGLGIIIILNIKYEFEPFYPEKYKPDIKIHVLIVFTEMAAKTYKGGGSKWRKSAGADSLANDLWNMYEQQICTNLQIRITNGQKTKEFFFKFKCRE